MSQGRERGEMSEVSKECDVDKNLNWKVAVEVVMWALDMKDSLQVDSQSKNKNTHTTMST
jgi:hypothetical protein